MLLANTSSGCRLGNGWTDIFAKVLSSNNQQSCWVFKRNYVKVDQSRKGSHSYWQGTAQCKVDSCPVLVSMPINKPTENYITDS